MATGQFGLHKPLRHGGSSVGAVTAGIEVGKERERKESQEDRAVAGEERSVEKHEMGMKTEKFAFGRMHKEAEQTDATHAMQSKIGEAAWNKHKRNEPMVMLKEGLEIGEGGSWPLASGVIMASLLKSGKTPSDIIANAEPGESDGKVGYFMTNIEGQRVQVDGEDVFLPQSLPEVKGKYVIGKDGSVSTYDDKLGKWVKMGDDSSVQGGPTAAQMNLDETTVEKKLNERIGAEASEWMNNKPLAISKLQSIRNLITKMTGQDYNKATKQWEANPENPTMERGWKDWSAIRIGRSVLPDVGQRFFDEEMFNIKQEAHLAVQATLKATLGGQFAMREADMLFRRTFDEAATPAENARRLTMLADQMELTMHTKDAIINYFNKHRRMRGYFGAQELKTGDDFYLGEQTPPVASPDAAPDAAPASQRKVVSQGGNLYDAETKEYIGPAQ